MSFESVEDKLAQYRDLYTPVVASDTFKDLITVSGDNIRICDSPESQSQLASLLPYHKSESSLEEEM